jgi:hypothetical protein
MTYEGTVKNGVVVFKAEPPPEGTDVSVTPVAQPVAPGPSDAQAEADDPDESIWDAMEKFVGRAPDLPKDAARNHDHYLYGAPKR